MSEGIEGPPFATLALAPLADNIDHVILFVSTAVERLLAFIAIAWLVVAVLFLTPPAAHIFHTIFGMLPVRYACEGADSLSPTCTTVRNSADTAS